MAMNNAYHDACAYWYPNVEGTAMERHPAHDPDLKPGWKLTTPKGYDKDGKPQEAEYTDPNKKVVKYSDKNTILVP